MRIQILLVALALVGCAHNPDAQTQTPTQRAGAALSAADECGGKLTDAMNSVLALAVQQEGIGAVKAAEFSYRALWAEAALTTVERDVMCARAFRNGWIQ